MIAVEATGNLRWFVEKSRELGHGVYLSHPRQTKAITSTRPKCDKVDLLPTVWIPGERQRNILEYLSTGVRLVRTRIAVSNELHAVYDKRNIEVWGSMAYAHPTPMRV